MICDVLHRRELYALSKPSNKERRKKRSEEFALIPEGSSENTNPRKRRGYNIHHPYCKSLHPELGKKKWNQVRCLKTLHNLFHRVFDVFSPPEVVLFVRMFRRLAVYDNCEAAINRLRKEFWRDNLWIEYANTSDGNRKHWEAILDRKQRGDLFRAVFGSKMPKRVIKIIRGYFRLVGENKTEEQVLAFLKKTFWLYCSDGTGPVNGSAVVDEAKRVKKSRRTKRIEMQRRHSFQMVRR